MVLKSKLAMLKHLAEVVESKPEANTEKGVASFTLLRMHFAIYRRLYCFQVVEHKS